MGGYVLLPCSLWIPTAAQCSCRSMRLPQVPIGPPMLLGAALQKSPEKTGCLAWDGVGWYGLGFVALKWRGRFPGSQKMSLPADFVVPLPRRQWCADGGCISLRSEVPRVDCVRCFVWSEEAKTNDQSGEVCLSIVPWLTTEKFKAPPPPSPYNRADTL